MKYRLTPVSPTLGKITLGRDTIGWTRKFENAWVATTKLGNGRGATSGEAFRDMVRNRNNHTAQQAGFADMADMIEKRNAEVRKEVAELNAAAGMPLFKVRRSGRYLV